MESSKKEKFRRKSIVGSNLSTKTVKDVPLMHVSRIELLQIVQSVYNENGILSKLWNQLFDRSVFLLLLTVQSLNRTKTDLLDCV